MIGDTHIQVLVYFLRGSLRMIPPCFIAVLKDWICERKTWRRAKHESCLQQNQNKIHCTAKNSACTHSVRSVYPGNLPVHHPGDASLVASMCQHLTDGLAGRHTVRGSQLLLHRPFLGWTGKHRDRRGAGEHLCRHMVLAARKLQPEKTRDKNGKIKAR